MSLQLRDKVIFLTGACGVSGLSHIQTFLDRGARVIASDRSDELVSYLSSFFSSHQSFSNLHLYTLDVTSEVQIESVFSDIVSFFSKL